MHADGMRHFKNCRLARMSDGHYCVIRDLGPVKGGKGLKHHEVVIDFSVRGLLQFCSLRLRRHAPKAIQAEEQISSLAAGAPVSRKRWYAPIARLESASRLRSPFRIMISRVSLRKRLAATGSPSSPARSRYSQAIWNDSSSN
jgi:hypothetical protein